MDSNEKSSAGRSVASRFAWQRSDAWRWLPSGAHRNIWLFAGCQVMQLSTNATLIAISGLVGLVLGSNYVHDVI